MYLEYFILGFHFATCVILDRISDKVQLKVNYEVFHDLTEVGEYKTN